MRAFLLFGACALVGCQFQVDGVSGGQLSAPADLSPGPTSDLSAPGDPGVADLAVPLDLAPPPSPPDLSTTKKPPPPMPDLLPPSPAMLTVKEASATGDTNLTNVGTVDWSHYGLNTATDFDDKATGNGRISAVTALANSSAILQYGLNPITFTWSDGATSNGKHASANATGSDVYVTSGGLQLSVPASTQPQRLIVWVASFNCNATMTISLSDASKPDYTDTEGTLDPAIHGFSYTIDFAAGSAAQTLTVSWAFSKAGIGSVGAGIASAALTAVPGNGNQNGQ